MSDEVQRRILEALGAKSERTPAGITISDVEVQRRVAELSRIFELRAAALRKKNVVHLRAECYAVYVACALMVERSRAMIPPENVAKLDQLIASIVGQATPIEPPKAEP